MPAAAQGTVGAGLSFLNNDGTAVGVGVDYSAAFRSYGDNSLGYVVDLGFNRHGDSDTNVLLLQGGVRYNIGIADAPVSPYIQGLAGLARFSNDFESTSEFAITLGGGVNIPVNESFTIRAALDFPIVMFEDNTQTYTRFIVGASFNVGE